MGPASYTCKGIDSVQFKLVNGRCISSSVADKNLANVRLDHRLDVGANQGDNDSTGSRLGSP